jgi:N-acetylneuraminate lyase
MKQFQGIYPALVTPFNSEGKINENALCKLVEWNLQKGVSGFYVGGSTGESFLLSMEERKRLLEIVIGTVGGRVDIIANIGAFSTEQGIELARHADRLGVSAISSVPPFYFKFTVDEYYAYYCDILREVSIPMIIYNIPAMSGITFSSNNLRKFLNNDRIIGLKHTSYDLFQMQRLIQEFPTKSIFIGHDEIYLSALSSGVKAAIGSTFNFMAEKYIAIEKHFRDGNLEQALKIQGEVNQIIEVLVEIGVFKGVKAALEILGISCGQCRKPFQPLSPEQLELLNSALKVL